MNRSVLALTTLIGLLALAALIAAALGGSSSRGSGRLDVVAAENVYGNIVSQIGGSHVSVTSILSDPNTDPHLFEPGTSNGLAVSHAKLVIQNGAGYDTFMQRLEDAAPNPSRRVVTIADVLGVHGSSANPHLWYDVPRFGRIAQAIAAALQHADPKHRSDYAGGLRRFESSLAPLAQEVARIRASYGGQPVAYTEPVPGYLLDAAGLRSLTPESFARSIEDGSEPPPQAVSQMTALFTKHQVRVLLYNSQAVSAVTTRIKTAAQRADIPVVGVSETLPPGMTFQQWQLGQARALARALAQ
ncbi:MAG: metal ABC transporter solute-binding protein, Zn/Mn family [Gaiellales bacterium]